MKVGLFYSVAGLVAFEQVAASRMHTLVSKECKLEVDQGGTIVQCCRPGRFRASCEDYWTIFCGRSVARSC